MVSPLNESNNAYYVQSANDGTQSTEHTHDTVQSYDDERNSINNSQDMTLEQKYAALQALQEEISEVLNDPDSKISLEDQLQLVSINSAVSSDQFTIGVNESISSSIRKKAN